MADSRRSSSPESSRAPRSRHHHHYSSRHSKPSDQSRPHRHTSRSLSKDRYGAPYRDHDSSRNSHNYQRKARDEYDEIGRAYRHHSERRHTNRSATYTNPARSHPNDRESDTSPSNHRRSSSRYKHHSWSRHSHHHTNNVGPIKGYNSYTPSSASQSPPVSKTRNSSSSSQKNSPPHAASASLNRSPLHSHSVGPDYPDRESSTHLPMESPSPNETRREYIPSASDAAPWDTSPVKSTNFDRAASLSTITDDKRVRAHAPHPSQIRSPMRDSGRPASVNRNSLVAAQQFKISPKNSPPGIDHRTSPEANAMDSVPDQVTKTAEMKNDTPSFIPTGLLNAAATTVTLGQGRKVHIKYSEPVEARLPTEKWMMLISQGTLELFSKSCYTFGRDADVCDIPLRSSSASGQHAVLQYRHYVPKNHPNRGCVKPYLMDLESTNSTWLNETPIEPRKFVELRDKDIIVFGTSQLEYMFINVPDADSNRIN